MELVIERIHGKLIGLVLKHIYSICNETNYKDVGTISLLSRFIPEVSVYHHATRWNVMKLFL